MPRRRSAFSLIELLVAMGILSVLMGILVPTIRAARSQSDAVACASNLRQLYNYQVFYADAYDGRLAAPSVLSNDERWPAKLAPYASKEADEQAILSLSCAAVDAEDLAGARVAYGVSSCVLMPNWQQRRAAKFDQSRIILMGDKPPSTLDHLVTDDSMFVDASGGEATWFFAENHRGDSGRRHARRSAANMLMADGHVRPMTHAELLKDSGHWFWGDAKLKESSYSGPCCD